MELQRGNDEGALDWFDRSLATGNEWAFTLLGVVAAFALKGETQEAKESLARLNRIAPQWSYSDLMRGPVGIGWERLRQGLRIALSLEA